MKPRRLAWKLGVFAALCVAPLLGIVRLHTTIVGWLPLAPYVVASGISFWQYRADKARAGRSARRVPERTLHVLDLFGGWPGALWAQQRYRHKTRKASFQVVFWLVVAAHQAAWGYWLLTQRAA